MKLIKVPLIKEGGNLKISIKVGKHGFARSEVLTNWETGDEVWVDNEATNVVFERMTAPKTKVSINF